jgi:hypothetical protein
LVDSLNEAIHDFCFHINPMEQWNVGIMDKDVNSLGSCKISPIFQFSIIPILVIYSFSIKSFDSVHYHHLLIFCQLRIDR